MHFAFCIKKRRIGKENGKQCGGEKDGGSVAGTNGKAYRGTNKASVEERVFSVFSKRMAQMAVGVVRFFG
jgi:hypothetical protein